MKILPVGAELFHAYGQTDTKKLIVGFSQFCERAPKNTLFGQSAGFINVTDYGAYSYHWALSSAFKTDRQIRRS